MALLAVLVLPAIVSAETQTFTAMHTYTLGDRDSKDDARQRCLIETKRKILEQAGVYIESVSEVKNFELTKDKITSFAAAVMQVKNTKEEIGFQQGHMTLTLTTTAQVDLEEVRKQLAARQLDAGVRDTVVAQQERLKRLESQLEAIQQQRQGGQVSAQKSTPQVSDISAADLEKLETQAAQGDAEAQVSLGLMYLIGKGVNQDYRMARQWYEKAAAQGHTSAQVYLGNMYHHGQGVPQDYAVARGWYEQAAAQGFGGAQYLLGLLYHNGQGVPNDLVREYMWFNLAAAHLTGDLQKISGHNRDKVARRMTPAQIAEAQRLAQQCQARQFKGC